MPVLEAQQDGRIRQATRDARSAILSVHRAAFGAEGEVISALVEELLDAPDAAPVLSLVAEAGQEVVGHVLFTRCVVSEAPGLALSILAPLAVLPAHQHRGVAGRLIAEGLALLRQQQVAAVFVLGDPDFYRRHGFAGGHQVQAPFAPPFPEAWMAISLQGDSLASLRGKLQCASPLMRPEHW